MPTGPDPVYIALPAQLGNQRARALVFVQGDDWFAVRENPEWIMRQITEEKRPWIECQVAALDRAVHLRADRIVAILEMGDLG